jgi:predicted TIM-barrel fold metal-dependent hydrolase
MDDRQRNEPAVVISCDSHVGPRLVEDLRPYCPTEHLDSFDEDASRQVEQKAAFEKLLGARLDPEKAAARAAHPNLHIPGHHDPHARLRDMDRDGVASAAIYHFSQNGENLPWIGQGLGTVLDFERGAIAYRIYNRWLADFCSVQPERHIGLAYLPTWDIDLAIEELHWARENGLRAVNFPPPSKPGHLEYNNPAWEPFWSACEDLDMALTTHSSGAAPFDYLSGPGGTSIMIFESGGYMARRAVWWLTMSGVFERHPNLRLVITEQFEGWWSYTIHEMDVVSRRFGLDLDLPMPPSDYVRSNVYLGASFLSRAQAEDAHREGYSDNVIWGSDYPHVEGTFLASDDAEAEPITRLALRNTFCGVPAEAAVAMAGANGVRAFGLDGDALRKVAQRIGAPSAAELTTAPESLPEIPEGSMAFSGQVGFLA